MATIIYMLEYLTDIMEDSNDFVWQSVKGAMLSCFVRWRKERLIGKIHQKLIAFVVYMLKRSLRASRFATQILKTNQLSAITIRSVDHKNNGQKYLHVQHCAACFAQVKSNMHPQKDCCHSKND